MHRLDVPFEILGRGGGETALAARVLDILVDRGNVPLEIVRPFGVILAQAAGEEEGRGVLEGVLAPRVLSQAGLTAAHVVARGAGEGGVAVGGLLVGVQRV